jgi:hypothetical protein
MKSGGQKFNFDVLWLLEGCRMPPADPFPSCLSAPKVLLRVPVFRNGKLFSVFRLSKLVLRFPVRVFGF